MRGTASNGTECSPQCMQFGDNLQVYDRMNKHRDAGIEMNKPPDCRWRAAVVAKSYVPRNESPALYIPALLWSPTSPRMECRMNS
jgi:hypothetical protein